MPYWNEYLSQFHHERTGVTSDVLERCLAGHHNPYNWLARSVSASAHRVLDVACGPGEMSRALDDGTRSVIGVDISRAELVMAQQRHDHGIWVQADALRLPFGDGSFDAVVCSLGLAIVRPTEELLAEIARVLRPGGVLSALIPTIRPLNAADLRVMGHLMGRLRTAPRFPTTVELATRQLLADAGLRKLEDARERYYFPVRSEQDAQLLLSAMYLPRTAQRRVDVAVEWLVGEQQRRGEVLVPVPLRRLSAIKASES